MKPENHRESLGTLVGNFHTLEFLLRAFLQGLPAARPMGIPRGTDIYSFPVGADVPENELTSPDSLGVLIKRFNTEMEKRDLPGIDPTLVDMRNAIAHGRVSAGARNGTLRLLNFTRAQNRKVRVTFNEELTDAWFKTQTERTYAALEIVAKQLGVKFVR